MTLITTAERLGRERKQEGLQSAREEAHAHSGPHITDQKNRLGEVLKQQAAIRE